MYVGQLPIPKNESKQSNAQLIRIVDRILTVKSQDACADVSILEDELDALVYGLYGLRDNEIGIIQKSHKIEI